MVNLIKEIKIMYARKKKKETALFRREKQHKTAVISSVVAIIWNPNIREADQPETNKSHPDLLVYLQFRTEI